MDTVLEILSIIGGIFGKISGVFSMSVGILGRFGVFIFLGGFFGLLLTFLWFLFRYLDKKRLTLPVLVFMLFFFIFLGGNLLLISNSAKTGSEATTQAVSETALIGTGEEVHI